MNNKVENVSNNKEDIYPRTVLTYDKDGKVIPVDVYPDGTAQDKEYSEDSK